MGYAVMAYIVMAYIVMPTRQRKGLVAPLAAAMFLYKLPCHIRLYTTDVVTTDGPS